MEETRIMMYLVFFSEEPNPPDITVLTQLMPSDIWSKGDVIPDRKHGLTRKESAWEYSSGYMSTLFLDEISDPFVEKFKPYMDEVKDYIKRSSIETKIVIVVEIVDDNKPSLFFNRALIDFANSLNAEIDVDMYLLDNDD